MGRIRSIKPEFFTHEGLFDLEKMTGLPVRLAFAGLWCQADKEGRFKWQVRRLKQAVLPYDDCDFYSILEALVGEKFITKYEVDGQWYGSIPSWKLHQRPHYKEDASSIPQPTSNLEPKSSQCRPDVEPIKTVLSARKGREGKGREGKEWIDEPTSDLRSDLPCHNPEVLPLAKKLVVEYQAASRTSHPIHPRAWTAAIACLNSGQEAARLSTAIRNAGVYYDAAKLPRDKRVSAATFFEGAFEQYLAGVPEVAPADEAKRSEPFSEKLKRANAEISQRAEGTDGILRPLAGSRIDPNGQRRPEGQGNA